MLDEEGASSKYLDTLLLYFEEEIMGEAYFYGLKVYFPEHHQHKKLELLAQVERFAAEAVRPLLDKYQLDPRPDAELKSLGEESCPKHGALNWQEFVTYMKERYPLYLDDFAGLENMAPAEDLAPLKVLTQHEVAAIEFAIAELNGDPKSLEPLLHYMGQTAP